MRGQRQLIEEEGTKVPAYIVTFSDMTTLLLTFFVMLLSLAQTQDPGLFYSGRDSFLKSISQVGLGMLYGKQKAPDLGNIKIKYFISDPGKAFEGRTIDAKEEEVRRIFQKVNCSMATMRSKIVAEKNNFTVTNIRFSPGVATLNEAAKKFLTKFCLDLQQGAGSKAVKLYVLGLAGDERTEKEQWILSAKRAQAVADCLQDILPLSSQWPIYSWGAGPGGDWVGQDSPISRQSQILIAVLRTND